MNVIGEGKWVGQTQKQQALSIHSMGNLLLLAGNCFLPKGLDSANEVGDLNSEQKSRCISFRKQRQALALSFRAVSPGGAVAGSVVIPPLLPPSSDIRAWPQALRMAFSPGPAQRSCEQRHLTGLPTLSFSNNNGVLGKRVIQPSTWWWGVGH